LKKLFLRNYKIQNEKISFIVYHRGFCDVLFKKVEVKGKITGGSPLERIELIEASGVATLPLINIG
jgi:hypothetical protein